MQTELRRSNHSNAEAQQTIARLSLEQLEQRQADPPSPRTRIILTKLRTVQKELVESKQLAATTLTFAGQLQGFFEQSQACASAMAVQTEIDRRKIEQASDKIDDLNLQLYDLRDTAEASIPELLAQTAEIFSCREQLQLFEITADNATADRDAAVAQAVQLQRQLDRAVAKGLAAAEAFTADREAARSRVSTLEAVLDEIVSTAQASVEEVAGMTARMLSAEQQLRDSRHIAQCAIVARDVAEAAVIAEQLQRGYQGVGQGLTVAT